MVDVAGSRVVHEVVVLQMQWVLLFAGFFILQEGTKATENLVARRLANYQGTEEERSDAFQSR
jgi:hypothetical protein